MIERVEEKCSQVGRDARIWATDESALARKYKVYDMQSKMRRG
jgi:hypothetical protein